MFDYIKASMISSYKEDIDMIEEELKENNIKYYTESKSINGDIEAKAFIIHAKINTPKELQLLVEKVAAGGIDMSFEFKVEAKK
ncbi:MAG: hypothetical protein N2448_06125 [Caloramator sp.]|nr:hypothetical protein [Caloramator sp.]